MPTVSLYRESERDPKCIAAISDFSRIRHVVSLWLQASGRGRTSKDSGRRNCPGRLQQERGSRSDQRRRRRFW